MQLLKFAHPMNDVTTNFNSLDLVPIGKLLRNNQSEWLRFFVPAYQRGYRWNADQVDQLIDDLEEFQARQQRNPDAFYCIQPLVVKPTEIDGKEYLEVIDGQQRLTTILLIIQALRQLQYEEERDHDAKPYFTRLPKEGYEIKYETRSHSSEWLPKLSETIFSPEAFEWFDNQNCDYSHFAEVFNAAYKKLKEIPDLNEFKRTLKDRTYFIWYLPSDHDDNNVEIFDRLNAGKIGLNNAELVKALLLQSSNIPKDTSAELSERDLIQRIAIEWDAIERRLHDDALWGFIYSQRNHGLEYESRMEYLLDLLTGKKAKDKEESDFTFKAYLDSYRRMMKEGGYADPAKRLEWVKRKWDKIKTLFDQIIEWYDDRHVYHRIGFILEYNPRYDIRTLQEILPDLSHTERLRKLDDIIRDTVGNIRSEQLFYGKREMSEILFLYNILLEDSRHSDTARFSFADYRQVRQSIGWDQEHVASSRDHDPDEKEQMELATDMIELITGKKPRVIETTLTDSPSAETVRTYEAEIEPGSLDREEELCMKLLAILNQPTDRQLEKEELDKIYDALFRYFNLRERDSLNGYFDFNSDRREKDFIWNFVLLNAKTNRSYGNHLFPVKRNRILSDEFDVYTPVGTRNVFEKAYSRRVENFLAWTRYDAKAYWDNIRQTLKPYLQLSDIK